MHQKENKLCFEIFSEKFVSCVALPKMDKVFCNKSLQGENRSQTKKNLLVKTRTSKSLVSMQPIYIYA